MQGEVQQGVVVREAVLGVAGLSCVGGSQSGAVVHEAVLGVAGVSHAGGSPAGLSSARGRSWRSRA